MYLSNKEQKGTEIRPFNIGTMFTKWLGLLSSGVSKDFEHYVFRTIFPRSEQTSNNCTDT